jgi:hypothetical protein
VNLLLEDGEVSTQRACIELRYGLYSHGIIVTTRLHMDFSLP